MPSQERQGIGVVVGRFQVPSLHEGHRHVLDRAASENATLCVVVGTSAGYPDARNPLSFDARAAMIRTSYPDADIVALSDHPSDEAWSSHLDSLLASRYSGADVRLYGSRDSFLGSYHGRFEKADIPPIDHPSGTELRNAISDHGQSDERFLAGYVSALMNRPPLSYQVVDMAVTDPATGMILLGRKGTDPEGKYRFPGGFVSPDDISLEAAAVREIAEETGAIVSDPMYLGSFRIDDWRYRQSSDRVLSAFFTANLRGGDIVAHDDIESVTWIKPDRLRSVIVSEHVVLADRFLSASSD